jgi:GMP synthase PP-ATPase subunit
MVDNGLLRLKEKEQVLAMLKDKCGVDLRAVDASGECRGSQRRASSTAL